jgi:hypothetical protein
MTVQYRRRLGQAYGQCVYLSAPVSKKRGAVLHALCVLSDNNMYYWLGPDYVRRAYDRGLRRRRSLC